jgi:hypothetical protein
LPCKVDYFNDKLMTEARAWRGPHGGKKDAQQVAVLPEMVCMPATAKDQYAGFRSRVEVVLQHF